MTNIAENAFKLCFPIHFSSPLFSFKNNNFVLLTEMQINGDGYESIESKFFALIYFCVSNSFPSFLSIESAMHIK